MSYTHSKEERTIYGGTASAGGVFTGTGDIAWFYAISMPFRLRRIGILTKVALTVAASIFSMDMQPTAGSASGRVTAWGGTMTVPLTNPTSAAGLFYISPELNLELLPGAALIINQTQGSTAGSGVISVYGEHRWESPVPKTGAVGVLANNANGYLLAS